MALARLLDVGSTIIVTKQIMCSEPNFMRPCLGIKNRERLGCSLEGQNSIQEARLQSSVLQK